MNNVIHDETVSSTACLAALWKYLAILGAIIEALAKPYDGYRTPRSYPI